MELVEFFTSRCDKRFPADFAAMQPQLAGLRPQERLASALRMRLEMLLPFRASWALALGLQAHPKGVAEALRQRAYLVDEMWHAAGDASTDSTWYAKRAALGAIYSSAELVLINGMPHTFGSPLALYV